MSRVPYLQASPLLVPFFPSPHLNSSGMFLARTWVAGGHQNWPVATCKWPWIHWLGYFGVENDLIHNNQSRDTKLIIHVRVQET